MPLPIIVKERGRLGVSPYSKSNAPQQEVGFGYVIIPEGVDRDEFVETCFRNNRISIIDDSCGNVMHECFITSEAIQNIKFPLVVGEMGLPVVWVSQPFTTNPMVVGTFPDLNKINIRDDEEFDIVREWGDGLLSIQGSAKDGTLFISVKGETFGVIQINAEGDENAVLRAISGGDIQVTANRNVDVISYTNLSVNVVDPENGNKSGFSCNKDVTEFSCTYGKDDDSKWVKTTVNASEVKTVANFGDEEYSNTVNANESNTTFKDCSVNMSDKTLTVSQDATVLELKEGKTSFTNNVTGLNELLTKMVEMVKTLTVSTAVGPSGTPLPPTVAAAIELEQLLKNFFNK